jgi:hypothetical protein
MKISPELEVILRANVHTFHDSEICFDFAIKTTFPNAKRNANKFSYQQWFASFLLSRVKFAVHWVWQWIAFDSAFLCCSNAHFLISIYPFNQMHCENENERQKIRENLYLSVNSPVSTLSRFNIRRFSFWLKRWKISILNCSVSSFCSSTLGFCSSASNFCSSTLKFLQFSFELLQFSFNLL